MGKRKALPPDPNQSAIFIPLVGARRPPPTFRRPLHPYWTENKARLIERYLKLFVLITKHGCYIDGFAGPQSVQTPDSWAAELVLASEPRWLRRFHLCERDPDSFRRLRELCENQTRPPGQPRRVIAFHHGDFNTRLPDILSRCKKPEATFCLLDQRTFECHWASVVALAGHHAEGHKVELFYFLATSWLQRSLSALQDTAVADAWWGGPGWRDLQGMNSISMADKFAARLRDELGYWSAAPWAIYKSAGSARIMYFMIHATDHPEAPGLMSRAYRTAVREPEVDRQLSLAGVGDERS